MSKIIKLETPLDEMDNIIDTVRCTLELLKITRQQYRDNKRSYGSYKSEFKYIMRISTIEFIE